MGCLSSQQDPRADLRFKRTRYRNFPEIVPSEDQYGNPIDNQFARNCEKDHKLKRKEKCDFKCVECDMNKSAASCYRCEDDSCKDKDGSCFSVCIDCSAESKGELMQLWLGVSSKKDASCQFCKKTDLEKEYDGYWHVSVHDGGVSICLDCRPFPLKSNLPAALTKADEGKRKAQEKKDAEAERAKKATTVDEKDRVREVISFEDVIVEWSTSDRVCDSGHTLVKDENANGDCMICCKEVKGIFCCKDEECSPYELCVKCVTDPLGSLLKFATGKPLGSQRNQMHCARCGNTGLEKKPEGYYLSSEVPGYFVCLKCCPKTFPEEE